MIVLYFLSHRLHVATTRRVLRPVLCFHMTSFSCGAKVVMDVDPACGCHEGNITSNSIFSVNIAQCVKLWLNFFSLLFVLLCLCECVCVWVC